jgi:hypothetical protein
MESESDRGSSLRAAPKVTTGQGVSTDFATAIELRMNLLM